MKPTALLVVAVEVVELAGVVGGAGRTSRDADQDARAISEGKLPGGYRDWSLISVAREEGELDDIRAIRGNDRAIQAYKTGTRPFPDGTIIVRSLGVTTRQRKTIKLLDGPNRS